jgi:hypothetical protein
VEAPLLPYQLLTSCKYKKIVEWLEVDKISVHFNIVTQSVCQIFIPSTA